MLTVGDIGLDLTVNQDGFNRQMNNIQSLASKVGKILAAAFAVDKLVNFSKECMELSNVQTEMETKLETVMRQRMQATDGMIQSVKDLTSAQQELGIIGDETQMGGAQQLATFLKTQSALETLIPAMNDLAAQQNGFNNTTESMKNIGNMMGKAMQGQTAVLQRVGITFSDAEAKVMKYGNEEQRAAMLAQIITNNVGHMNSTLAQTPQGQIQALKNNFGDLQEVLGSLLLNAILPIIRGLNRIVLWCIKVASAAREMLKAFGIFKETKVSIGATQDLSNSLENVGNSSDNASKKTTKGNDSIAKSAKKATKEIKGIIGGLDEINNLNVNKTSGTNPKTPSTGGLDGTGSLGDLGNSLLNNINKDLDKTNDEVSELQKKLEKMKDLFLKGFNKAFKNNFKQIQKHCNNIKKSLSDIFGDSKVKNASKKFYESLAYNVGRVAGSIADIGATFAENLLGGLDKYLEENKDRLKEHIIRLFDIGTEISDICGDFGEAVANIFRVFRSDEAKKITSNIIGIFTEAKLGVLEVVGTLGKDILDIITSPIVNNQDKIKEAFEGLFSPINTILGGIKDNLEHAFDTFWDVYEKYIKPGVDNITDGLSGLLDFILDTFIKGVLPCLDDFSKAWVETFGPKCEEMLENLLEGLGRTFYGITEAFKGVIEIINGIRKGDWSKAWQGLVDVAKGIWDTLGGVLKIFGIDLPSSNEVASKIKSWWKKITDTVGNIILKISTVIENIRDKIIDSYNNAKNWLNDRKLQAKTMVESIYGKAKETFIKAKDWLKDKKLQAKTMVESIYGKAKETFIKAKNWLKDKTLKANTKIESVRDKIISSYNKAKSWLKSKVLHVKINVTSVVGSVKNIVNRVIDGINNNVISKLKIGGFSVPKIPRLASGGYVKANTPQLAMIGDNKRYGEIVAPEDKMNEMVNNALQGYTNMLQGQGETYTGNIVINLDGNTIFREKIMDVLRQLKRQGVMI